MLDICHFVYISLFLLPFVVKSYPLFKCILKYYLLYPFMLAVIALVYEGKCTIGDVLITPSVSLS